MNLKKTVIEHLLRFVSAYVPIEQARLATLGGSGLEASIWKSLCIPPDRGWLIERNRTKTRELVRTYGYSSHNQLATFSQNLAGHGGERASIDFFHLDLCGTMTRQTMADCTTILPLVLGSRGRCLALTVADARRNHILEEWPLYKKRGRKLLGKDAADALYAAILDQQKNLPVREDSSKGFIKPFDPENGAKREFGLMVAVLALLGTQKPLVACAMQRYIYVSRFAGSSFRMRSEE